MRPRAARAATLLLGLLALCALLPGVAASADSGHRNIVQGQIDLSARYGCSDGGWVEARLRINTSNDNPGKGSGAGSAAPAEPVQVGYTTTRGKADAAYPSGGPVIVAVDNTTVLVRLAGPPPSGASIFATRLANGSTTVLDLPPSCSDGSPTNFRMQPVSVQVGNGSCIDNGAFVAVSVTNANAHRVGGGPQDVDYTVLSTSASGTILQPPGTMLRFTGAGTQIAQARIPVDGTPYEIRVIGMDGTVLVSSHTAPSCGPASIPTSSSPVTSVPPSSEVPTTAASTATAGPVPSTSSHRPSPSTTPELTLPTATSAIEAPPPTTSAPVTSPPAAVPTPAASPSGIEASRPRIPPLLANGPNPKSSVAFKLQPTAALVVVVDALAIGGLVAGTMHVARRR